LLAVSYAAMALAGLLVGGAFQLFGLTPANHNVTILETRPSWNYTTFLDFAVLILMAVLAWRFVATGGIEMLRAHRRRPAVGTLPVKDPVCGMSVDPVASPQSSEYRGSVYHFCSARCRSEFEKNPDRYAVVAAPSAPQAVGVGRHAPAQSEFFQSGANMEDDETAVDPVCGMTVDKATAEYRSFRDGTAIYFCSAGCKQAFDKDPAKYLKSEGSGEGHHH
jgi:YHS domain-containing protein